MPNKEKVENRDKVEKAASPKGGGGIKTPSIPKVPMPKLNSKSSWRGFVIYAILVVLLFVFFAMTASPTSRFLPVEPLSQAISDIKVEKVEIDGDKLTVKLKEGKVYTSRKEESQSFFEALNAAKVDPTQTNITIKDRTFSQAWATILTTFLPLALMILFFFFIFR